jgi:hypothetical protein
MCAVLRCDVLRCAALCCAVLCCAVLCCAILLSDHPICHVIILTSNTSLSLTPSFLHLSPPSCDAVTSNSIGIKGAEALASYLMEADTLQSLRLSSNRICNDGAIAMASVSRMSAGCWHTWLVYMAGVCIPAQSV